MTFFLFVLLLFIYIYAVTPLEKREKYMLSLSISNFFKLKTNFGNWEENRNDEKGIICNLKMTGKAKIFGIAFWIHWLMPFFFSFFFFSSKHWWPFWKSLCLLGKFPLIHFFFLLLLTFELSKLVNSFTIWLNVISPIILERKKTNGIYMLVKCDTQLGVGGT